MSESLILAAAREIATATEQLKLAEAVHIEANRAQDAAAKKADEARVRAKEAERRLVELSRKPVVAKPVVVAPPDPAPVVPQPSPAVNTPPTGSLVGQQGRSERGGPSSPSHVPNLARRRA